MQEIQFQPLPPSSLSLPPPSSPLTPPPSQALSLKLHSRMFAARTALTTREVYFTLSEKLRELFQSEEGCVITLAMGVDPADDRCLKLLARVRTFGGKGGGKWQECMMMSFPAIKKNDVIMCS